MTKSRWSRWAAVMMAASMVLAACGDDNKESGSGSGDGGTAGDKKTVAIGFVGPLTGDNANLGINIRDGMKVAVEEWNAKSTKFTYQMKEFDTQGDPAQAPGQKDKYVPDESIIGIVGPTFSGETKAVLPDLEQAGLVMVSPSCTNVDLPNVVPNSKVFHRVIPDDGVQAQGVTDYVIKVIKPKKVALIHDNTEYGKGLWEGVVKLLDAAGINTSTTDAVDPKGQDYSA
ncbi:MAG TPA: branched-chain amino acid ABC transporter substrate-binding protein, partial [Acidimicrobiia bacterium]